MTPVAESGIASQITPAEDGGADTQTSVPWAGSQVAQLDRNEALRGPPPGAVERVRAAIARGHVYPHEALARATAAAAEHLGVNTHQLILTTGVDEAADLCILELGDPHTVIPGLRRIWRPRGGAQPSLHRMGADHGLRAAGRADRSRRGAAGDAGKPQQPHRQRLRPGVAAGAAVNA